MQGGVLSLALLLPASAFPVETSQSSEKEGGLQTTVEFFGLLFLFVGFFHSYHANGRTYFFFRERKSKQKESNTMVISFFLRTFLFQNSK